MLAGMAKAPRDLRTIPQVIAALGDGDSRVGRQVLLRLTGKHQQNITNWLAFGKIPKVFFLPVSQALAARGCRVRPSLFGLAPLRGGRVSTNTAHL